MNWRYNLKWAAALLVAGGCSIWTPRGWQRIGRAFGLWFGLISSGGKRVGENTRAVRLRTCRPCPLFFKPLETCGSPLRPDLRGYGCWCFLPEKAKYEESQCYLDTEVEPGTPGGWMHATSGSHSEAQVPSE